jgi:hypothetical protein
LLEMKLMFAPVRLIAARLADRAGRKTVRSVWGMFDDDKPPRPDQRGAGLARLAGALVLEGAVYRLVSGLSDHVVRRWFAGLTGRWPGEDAPETAEAAAAGKRGR